MKYTLLKYNLISKPFTSGLKINKFGDVASSVKINAIKIPSDFHQQDTHGRDKTPPKEGEIYPLPVVNSKLLALEHGYIKAFERDPVSAYYSMKVKDKMYHVFNAARIVRIKANSFISSLWEECVLKSLMCFKARTRLTTGRIK
jgi:hypothetical protein